VHGQGFQSGAFQYEQTAELFSPGMTVYFETAALIGARIWVCERRTVCQGRLRKTAGTKGIRSLPAKSERLKFIDQAWLAARYFNISRENPTN